MRVNIPPVADNGDPATALPEETDRRISRAIPLFDISTKGNTDTLTEELDINWISKRYQFLGRTEAEWCLNPRLFYMIPSETELI